MYYVNIAGKTHGPYDQEAILSGLREGRIPRDAMLCAVGSQQWMPISDVPEFAHAVPPPQAPMPRAPAHEAPYGPPPYGPQYGPPPARPRYGPPPPGGSSNKVAAGLCGIFIGWLGIHKFILGMQTPGLIMLLVSLVGGIVTCGLSAIVMSIIGLIEGIIYLTKSDEEFYQIYVVEKKEWF
jgi:TM2 domain-containing membrane protein YozV